MASNCPMDPEKRLLAKLSGLDQARELGWESVGGLSLLLQADARAQQSEAGPQTASPGR